MVIRQKTALFFQKPLGVLRSRESETQNNCGLSVSLSIKVEAECSLRKLELISRAIRAP